jgi:hypothetical protein
MGEWARVKWTEAAQIAAVLSWDDLGADARSTPETFFKKLVDAGRLNEATFFLGQALPRFETVAWAARLVRETSRWLSLPDPRGDALKATLLWVQDPSDIRRRAAFDAASRVRTGGSERLAALAAFFSGGSLSPAAYAPVLAPSDAAGRLAAGAVLAAAAESPDRKATLYRALQSGGDIAKRGLAA